jgi:1-acyl-sn-glycerol-3-phosphate acyltransferase
MYTVIRALIHGACRVYFRLEVTGRENLPATGAYIVSPIHRSNLDTPVLCAITTRRLRYMGKESLWKSRPLGWLLTALGGFPVQRGTADREALKAGLACVERGEPLVMFPEGTRQVGPDVAEMFDGPAYVACRTGTPIVPIGLGNTEAAMPKGSKFIRPVKMTIVIGAPIQPPPLKESGRVSRGGVRELTARLGEEIQVLFDEAQALAGTPNRR